MADATGIEWADATWNPVVGCSIVSPGCTHCYAMRFAAARLDGNPNTPHYAGTTKRVNGNAVWSDRIVPATDHILTQPLRWKKPRRIFVNSMGDLFHEGVLPSWLDRVFAVMALAPWHTFMVLTKRPDRARDYLSKADVGQCIAAASVDLPCEDELIRVPSIPLRNVWLGASVEDQPRGNERVPQILDTPAAVRFLSCEPLIAHVDLTTGRHWLGDFETDNNGPILRGIDWVIAGGESGKDARPMHPDWARALRDQCAAAGVPFFFKQWGEWAPRGCTHGLWLTAEGDLFGPGDASDLRVGDGCAGIDRVGKAAAGRTLDGRTHDDFPDSQRGGR